MGGTPRLVRRAGTFYFRMAVPREWVPVLRSSEIKATLQTTDRARATFLCRSISNELDRLFLNRVLMSAATFEDLNKLIRRVFQDLINDDYAFHLTFVDDKLVDNAEAHEVSHAMYEYLKGELAKGEIIPSAKQEAATLCAELDFSGSALRKDEALKILQLGMMRAYAESFKRKAALWRGDFDNSAGGDTLFAGMAVNGLPPLPEDTIIKHYTFADAVEEHAEHQKAKGLKEKSIGDDKLTMEWAFSAISRDKPLREISKDDIRTFRNLLGNLPKNMDKNEKTKGLSAAKAAAAGADLEKLAYRTKRKRFLVFTSLFHWALQEGKLDVDVSLGISIETPPKGAKEKSRIPYSTQQLKQIFSHPIFRGRNSTQYNVAGAYLVKDYLFWVPLIALFSGMRQGEILQLTKADIRQENGVRYFDVNKSESDGYGGAKTLKTASSERKVPIHPVLIDLGFLEYVEQQENGRIFLTAKLGSDGTYSQYFSKQWRAIAVAGGFYQRKTVFHSFRHSFIDACRNAKVPENLAEQIVGHKEGSTHSIYGSGASLDVLQGEIERIAYAGLNLEHLKGEVWEMG